MVLATFSISGAAVIIEPSTVAVALGFEPAVLGLDAVEVEGAGDDQSELVDVDRLAVEIIGAAGDRLERAFAGAVAGGDDDLGVGLEPHHFGQRRKALARCRRDRAEGRGRA